jgi:Uma2 family endonuclease
MSSSNATHADPELPPDARLVEPETRCEVHDGELVHVAPADEPHGTRHSKISALLEAHAAPDFDVASDMLTRTSVTSDVAPDASVFPSARDPRTGGRQLEHLAFEVVSTESLSHAGHKAAKLVARGVRRVFAIDVERPRALEWAAELGTWRELDAAGHIEDPALEVPLPINDMIHVSNTDDAVQRALIAKGNPVFEAYIAKHWEEAFAESFAKSFAKSFAESFAKSFAKSKAEAVLAVLAARGIAVGDAERARILGEQNPEQLDRWLAGSATCATVAELFTLPS